MSSTGIISLLLIVANLIFSYKGFTNTSFFETYKFRVDSILVNKDYKRIITSAFLHVGWPHLILNMISLWAFSSIEFYLGPVLFLLIYFISMVGGNLFCLFIHKHTGSYSAVGASGAVSGIMFASIALFPGMGVGLFGIPVSIPGWIYGLLFVLFSIYGIRSGKDNIGHEAHLAGALTGMIVALLIHPAAITENYQTILLIAVPAIIFIYLIVTKPQLLLVDNFFYKKQQHFYNIDQQYNAAKKEKQDEVDRILDKINKKGINSLSKKEKDILDEYSKTLR